MNQFNESGLSANILKAIEQLGFETPTPVQAEVIPAILNTTENIIALAQTGTGKTAAFGLPLLENTDTSSTFTSGLILCPTRELCIQITKDLENYSKFISGVKICPVYGGADIVRQINKLKDGVHIVVGTPGRVLDLIKRKVLKVQQIQWLVLDEADEMLNMGFQEDLDTILAETPEGKRTLLFSATMPNGIRKIADKYMRHPMEITIGKKNVSTENVSHEFFMVHAKDRYLALKRIADIHPGIYSIIFCRTRQETKDVAEKLIQDGYNADALHGDLSQAQRDHVMSRFRNKTLQMLVATDVAARGLDVQDLTHVINYNLPDDQDAYIHRSGRTGRAGKQGVSISIIHTREMGRIRELERITGAKFQRKMVPLGRDICEKQLFHLVDKMEHILVNDEQIEQYLTVIYKKLEWLSREDLIKKFVSLEFNRFLDYYKHAGDINVKAEQRDDRNQRESGNRRESGSDRRRERSESVAFSRLYINAGLKHGLTPPRLIGLINDYGRSRNVRIGKIDIQRNFSFFEVEAPSTTKIIAGFRGANFEGLPLEVNFAELSKPKPGNRGFTENRPAGKPQRKPKAEKPDSSAGKKPNNDRPFWEQFLEADGETGRKKSKKKQK
ncbi:MAG: DEAD/DEAH box helicase [Bacteroidales bacterium]